MYIYFVLTEKSMKRSFNFNLKRTIQHCLNVVKKILTIQGVPK